MALKAEAICATAIEIQNTDGNEEVDEKLISLTTITKYKLSEESVCPHPVYAKIDCLGGSCAQCEGKANDMLEPLSKYQKDSITWHRWESVKVAAR